MKHLFCLVVLVAHAAAATFDGSSNQAPASSSLAPRLTDTRIVGGSEVHIALHPHQISLRYKPLFPLKYAFAHRCGGSIYSENIVITAAHCIIATVESQFQVVAGTNNRNSGDGTIVRVQKIIRHENYNSSTFDNDIAILVLATPLQLNNFTIKAVELNEDEPRNGAKSIVTGWGTTAEGGTAANKLQQVEVPIVSNEICNEDYEGEITDSMLCAGLRGAGGKDACQGDSGGPLLVHGKLAGVVSWGYGCARPEYPGVYSKISYLLPWLRENIAKYI